MKTQKQIKTKQEQIDFVASILSSELDTSKFSPEWYAEQLDICVDQDVWLYEPDFSDHNQQMVFATYRLESSDGTRFHIACRLDGNSQILEWIGPFDITIMRPARKSHSRLAA